MLYLAGHVDAVQQHVGGAQQVRQLLLLDAEDELVNGALVFGAGLVGELAAKWSMAAVRKPPVPQAGSITFSRLSSRD